MVVHGHKKHFLVCDLQKFVEIPLKINQNLSVLRMSKVFRNRSIFKNLKIIFNFFRTDETSHKLSKFWKIFNCFRIYKNQTINI